jgi:hypothetical protein
MIYFLRAIALIAAMAVHCGAVFGQEEIGTSANAVMPGCRNFLVGPYPTNASIAGARCGGLVEGIAYGASAGRFVCAPPTATVGQTVRVVMKYIEDQPERLHENFKLLAYEALRAAWPCKK